MRAKRFAPWLEEFDHGMIVLSQSGLPDAFWYNRRKWTQIRRELFYAASSEDELEPLTMRQMAFPLMFLVGGLLLGAAAFCIERVKGKRTE